MYLKAFSLMHFSQTRVPKTAFYYPNNDQALLYVDVSSGLTDGKGCLVIDDGGGSRYLEGSAEL